jgi:hypothetical protein
MPEMVCGVEGSSKEAAARIPSALASEPLVASLPQAGGEIEENGYS